MCPDNQDSIWKDDPAQAGPCISISHVREITLHGFHQITSCWDMGATTHAFTAYFDETQQFSRCLLAHRRIVWDILVYCDSLLRVCVTCTAILQRLSYITAEQA